MSEKKHIDRLFREKLKDFEATPSDAVWQNISTQLHPIEGSSTGIPRWWKLAGVAAGIIMLITIGSIVFNTNASQKDPAVVEDDAQNSKVKQTPNNPDASKNDLIDINTTNEDGVVSKDDTDNDLKFNETTRPKDVGTNSVTKNNIDTSTSKITVASDNLENASKDKKPSTTNTDNINLVGKATVESDEKEAVAENKNSTLINNKDGVAKFDKNNSESFMKRETDKSKETIALSKSIESSNVNMSLTSKDVKGVNALTFEGINVFDPDNNKPSIIDVLAQMEAENITDEEKENIQRWSVSPHIAPVYFNTMGSGSSIDNQFNNNDKTGDINMSYGVVANYNFNKKLSIRSGINQVKLGYSTQNVVVYNNIDPQVDTPLRNVSLNEYGQTLSFLSADDLGFAQVPGVVADNIESSINQQFGFIEVPLELEYKVSDKKFGLSVIGGFSTLFLNENEISTTLQGDVRVLGEATNINQTSFSANLGLGVDYKLSEQFNLSLEPIFKYQLNTFSDTSGNFNPYFIGVYTGFSFKF